MTGGLLAALAAVAIILTVIVIYYGALLRRCRRQLENVVEQYIGQGIRCVAPPRPAPLRTLSERQLRAPRSLEQYRVEVDALVERACELGDFGPPSRLRDACLASLRGGKRVRAAILLEIVRAATPARAQIIDAAELALALEYVHAASLVIDDLPEFDNAATRRGAPPLHVAYGPAVTQLAAVALQTAALQCLARQADWIREHYREPRNADRCLTQLLALFAETMGQAAYGQHADSVVGCALGAARSADGAQRVVGCALGAARSADGALGAVRATAGPPTPQNAADPDSNAQETPRDTPQDTPAKPESELPSVRDLLRLKTGVFFEAAVAAGWILSGRRDGLAEARELGALLGEAFQLADDIKDEAEDSRDGRANYSLAYGAQAARIHLASRIAYSSELLTALGLGGPLWDDYYDALY